MQGNMQEKRKKIEVSENVACCLSCPFERYI